MIFPKIIKVSVAVLLICIMPCGIHAQDKAKIRKGDNRKEERIEKMESNDSNEKIWDKLKVWKTINFDFFKCSKEKKENSHKHQYSVGTNLLSWVYFGTANLEFNASLSNHFSMFAGGKYNPFKITTKGERDIFHTQKTGYLGAKWWPWFVNTGWWIGVKGQYSDFSTVGIMSSYTREGVAVGGGISGGYSFMLGRHFNLDLGLGLWGGTYLKYVDYEKPDDTKPNIFFKFDNIIVSFTYLF